MRVDLVIRDLRETLDRVVRALDNRLTASENFEGEGSPGDVLTSNGPGVPPSYQPGGGGGVGGIVGAHTHGAEDITSGIMNTNRIVGAYLGITELAPREIRAGVAMYANPMGQTVIIPSGFDSLVAGPYAISGTLTVVGRLVIV